MLIYKRTDFSLYPRGIGPQGSALGIGSFLYFFQDRKFVELANRNLVNLF